jgi:hypothetical protein
LTDQDRTHPLEEGEVDLECVFTCQGIDLAQIYKSKLEAAGIPVLLSYEAAGLVFGITIDGLGQVKVMVPAEFAAEAEDILGVGEAETLDEGEEEPFGEPDEGEEETLPDE